MKELQQYVALGEKGESPLFKGCFSRVAVERGRVVAVGQGVGEGVGGQGGQQWQRAAREGWPVVKGATGQAVGPGRIDCHLHLVWYGTQQLKQVDLRGCVRVEEALERLRQGLTRRPDGPLIGYGLDDESLAERRLVWREELDQLSRDRALVVQRICGHIAVGNTKALSLVPVKADAHGKAEETEAMRLVSVVGGIGPGGGAGGSGSGSGDGFDIDEAEAAILEACRVLHAQGITAVGTMLDRVEEWRAFDRLNRDGRLPIRVSMMPPMRSLEVVKRLGVRQGDGDERLRWGPMKMFADGTLGGRTALLSADYADAPGVRGTAVSSREWMVEQARLAAAAGFGVAIHAIGDLALDHALDAVEANRAEGGQHRCRIEHVALARDDQIERMARLGGAGGAGGVGGVGVMAAVQPQFVTSDPWTPARLGPARVRWAYRSADLVKAGVEVGLSSDAPIERIDCGACLAAAAEGHAWRDAGQNLSWEEAHRTYTAGSARLIGFEDVCGEIREGMAADLAWTDERGRGAVVG